MKWVSFYNLKVIFMANLIFPLTLYTFFVQETASRKKIGVVANFNIKLIQI